MNRKAIIKIVLLIILNIVTINIAYSIGAFDRININWKGLSVFIGSAIVGLIIIILFEKYETQINIKKDS